MTRPQLGSAFDPSQLHALRRDLRAKYDRLLPLLEEAVRDYQRVPPAGESYRLPARRHAGRAQQLERATRRFLGRIEKTDPVIREAAQLRFVPSDRFSFANVSLSDLMALKPRWVAADAAKAALGALLEDAQTWRHVAEVVARGRPGRRAGNRINLCAWLGKTLSVFRFTLSTRPKDLWGRVFVLICEAARIPVPTDVSRDLRKALAILQTRHPTTAKAQSPARKKRR